MCHMVEFSLICVETQVNLDSLTPQQLSAVKKQLDEEVEHLSTSYSQLLAAQNKFKECLRCVQGKPRGKEMPSIFNMSAKP